MQEKAEERFTIIGFIFLLYAIVLVVELFKLSQSINDCNKALDNLCGTFEIGNFTIIIIRILILGVGGLMLLGIIGWYMMLDTDAEMVLGMSGMMGIGAALLGLAAAAMDQFMPADE
jgi:hypothetical protein